MVSCFRECFFLCIFKYECAFPVGMLSSDSFALFFRFSKVRKINFSMPFGGRCVVGKFSWKEHENGKYSWTDRGGKLSNFGKNFSTSLSYFQLKQKLSIFGLSNFRLFNLKLSNSTNFQTPRFFHLNFPIPGTFKLSN